MLRKDLIAAVEAAAQAKPKSGTKWRELEALFANSGMRGNGALNNSGSGDRRTRLKQLTNAKRHEGHESEGIAEHGVFVLAQDTLNDLARNKETYLGRIRDEMIAVHAPNQRSLLILQRSASGELSPLLLLRWATYDDTLDPPYTQWWPDLDVTELAGATDAHAAAPTPNNVPEPTSDLFQALVHARNLVLEGVPGTGKTFAFHRLATHWNTLAAPTSGAVHPLADPAHGPVSTITFHPATTYEDFVEGIRPARTTDSNTDFREPVAATTGHWAIEDGFFVDVCKRAAAHPDRSFLVLLDELNRANVPKVLGDLLTTLERSKRARHDGEAGDWDLSHGGFVTLPTSKRTFFVPDNVFVVGTMNTSDRSVTPLDAALRRRFAFRRVEPMRVGDLPDIIARKANGAAQDGVTAEGVCQDPWWQHTLAVWRDLNLSLGRRLGPDALIGHSYILDLADDLARWMPSSVVVPDTGSSAPSWPGGGERASFFRALWEHTLLPQVAATLRAAGVEHLANSDSDADDAVLTPLRMVDASLTLRGEEGFLRTLGSRLGGDTWPAPGARVAPAAQTTAAPEA